MQTQGTAIDAVMRDILVGIGEKFDEMALVGTGSGNEPTGIVNQSGVNTTAWGNSPAAIAWADVVAAEKALIDDKALRGELSYLCDPATFADMKTTTRIASDGGSGFIVDTLNGKATLNGYPLFTSTHCPADTLIFANWDELIVAEYGAIGIATDEYSGFASGTVGIRGIYPANIGVRHAVSFCLSTP